MSVLLREAIGGSIRRARAERNRTLRDVSHEARVSLGYLSEVERGRKEPSSELLAAICEALSLPLPDLLDDVAAALRPTPLRRRDVSSVAVLDPALRHAVEEALEPVSQDGEDDRAADDGETAVGGTDGEGEADGGTETLPAEGAAHAEPVVLPAGDEPDEADDADAQGDDDTDDLGEPEDDDTDAAGTDGAAGAPVVLVGFLPLGTVPSAVGVAA